jgi:hypothetical protein
MPRTRLTPLYDTYVLAANQATPATIQFFGSRTAAANGIWLTNLKKPGEIDANESFLIQAIRAVCIGMDEADIINLYKNYCLRLKIGNTTEVEAPLDYWPGGAGIAGVAAVATTASATTINVRQWTNGQPDPRAICGFGEYSIPISNSTFSVELAGTTFTTLATGSGICLRIYLDGLFQKEV